VLSILNPLNDLVAWVIMRLHSALGALFGENSGWAWGLSIAVLVMLIRLCLVPLFVKQMHAQRKMAEHAPHLQELRKKYKNDKQRLQEETMKFYKENGVNPLAGCLPMIPQMIVFFSLFSVLRQISGWRPGTKPAYGLTESVVRSAQQARIFGVHLADKLLFAHPSPPAHVAIVIVVTVCVSSITTFMTVRQSSKRGLMQTSVDPDNPMAASQKYMMYIVPFFSLTGLYWQYGLVLYWVTTNVWTLGQQHILFRNWTPPVPANATAGVAGPGGTRVSGSPVKSNVVKGNVVKDTVAKSSGGSATKTSGASRPASASRTASAARPANAARGSATRTGDAARTGSTAKAGGTVSSGSTAKSSAGSSTPGQKGGTGRTSSAANGSTANGEKRGLLRLGRAKPEPEPEPVDDVPATKVVRQQPQRQARSKRSGKRS
jgi:YidC/Oxa1 family membrane protein insertase